MIKSRKEIKHFILNLERKFPVSQWQVNDIFVWPIIRYHLFFYLIKTTEKNKHIKDSVVVSSNQKKTSIINSLDSIRKWFFFLMKLKTKKNLFFSPNHVRVNYNGEFFNRFFDSYIIKEGIENESYVFDYHMQSTSNYEVAHKNIYYPLTSLNKGYKQLLKLKSVLSFRKDVEQNYNLNGYEDFLVFLLKTEETVKFANSHPKKWLLKYVQSIALNVSFFDEILKKVKPKEIFIICYYSAYMHALLVAAKKRGVKVIEIQHGPMSDMHMCYTNWNKVPSTGYEILPNEFWCWDEFSFNNMNSWTSTTNNLHNSILSGNPWVDFFKGKKNSISLPNNLILYTLQPFSFDILFPDVLITFIRDNDFSWYLRLHPRQLDQIDFFKNKFHQLGLYDKINIEQASSLPLPVLLSKCKLHVTHFSGSAIEASIMNVYSVLFDKLGEESFKELVEIEKAIYLPIDELFQEEFKNILNKINV